MSYTADRSLKLPSLAALAVILICVFIPSSSSLFFKAKENIFDVNTLLNILAPAFISSMFIERAAEVFLIAFRKANRIEIENRLLKLLARLEKATDEDQEKLKTLKLQKQELEQEYKDYRRITIRLAFSVTIAFSAFVSVFGVRVLSPFFEFPYVECLNGIINLAEDPELCPSGVYDMMNYYKWFNRFDIFITTFVIAGGATGIHSIVTAITSFADTVTSENKKKAGTS